MLKNAKHGFESIKKYPIPKFKQDRYLLSYIFSGTRQSLSIRLIALNEITKGSVTRVAGIS